MDLTEHTVESKTIFEGVIVKLKVDQARLPNGSVWLGLCLYTPCGNAEGQHPVPPQIIDYATGRTIPTDDYGRLGRQLLSPRETEVLKLVAKGFMNKEIADQLNISINTVLSHRKNLTAKLGIKTVSGLSFYAMMNGYISDIDNK